MNRLPLARLIVPTLVTVLLAAGVLGFDAVIAGLSDHPMWQANLLVVWRGLLTLLCVSIGWLVSQFIDVVLWQGVVQRRTGTAPPGLLVAIVRVLVFAGTAAVIVGVVFQTRLNALLVSSGVVGIVLGFALQRMISDFFSGIAINLERPFRVGDWVQVEDVIGRVAEVNWRATHLVTLEDVTVVMPNSHLAERRLLNYTRPAPHFRTEMSVSLEYGVPLPDAKRVLLAAVRATAGVRATPPPDVLATEFGADGVLYRIRYYIDNYPLISIVRDAVAVSISQHLWQAGMSVPFPKRDVYYAPMPQRELDRTKDRVTLLARSELFGELTAEELTALAGSLQLRRVGGGESVIRQGEPGDSLFIVVDGLLSVQIGIDGEQRNVGQLVPGQCFGEMSLLSGEPRSATIAAIAESTVYELSHDALAPLLAQRPEIADRLSRIVADRKLQNEARLRGEAGPTAAQQRSLAQDMLRRMRSFFRLGIP